MSEENESGGNGAGDDGASRIYVGNLIPKANEVHLKTLFARFGVIHNIWVARKPPGFAFVNYESAECAKRAVEAYDMVKGSEHAIEILGKPVKVQMAGEKVKKKAKTNEEPTQTDKDKSSNGSRQKRHSRKNVERVGIHENGNESDLGARLQLAIAVMTEIESVGRDHSRQAIEEEGEEAEARPEIQEVSAESNTMDHAPETDNLGRRREAAPEGRVTIATSEAGQDEAGVEAGVAGRGNIPEASTASRHHDHEHRGWVPFKLGLNDKRGNGRRFNWYCSEELD